MTSHDDTKMPFVAPVRSINLLWVPILGGAWLVTSVWGTPHLRVEYTWNGRDRAPSYSLCRYWGGVSTFQVRPGDGKCPLFILAHTKLEG